MPVPKKHGTHGKTGRRRSHLALKQQGLSSCSHCNQPKLPHRMCANCGYYNEVEVENVLAKELKKKEKQKRQSQ